MLLARTGGGSLHAGPRGEGAPPGVMHYPAERPLTLGKLLDIAARNNPEILAAREASAAADHHRSVAGGFPDPSITYTHFLESVETRLGPQRRILQLVQPIPFPGKLSLRKSAASYDAMIRGESEKIVLLRVLREVKTAYYSLTAVEEALAVVREMMSVLDRLEETVRVRVETGRRYQQDLLSVQIEKIRLEEKELKYRSRKKSLILRLNALLNREAHSPLSIERPASVSVLPYSADELKEMALGQPGLRSSELSIERRRTSIALSRRGYFPDFTVGLGYIDIGGAPTDIPRSGEDAWSVSIGVRVPLWFGKVRGSVRETQSLVREQEWILEAGKASVLAEAGDLYSKYTTAVEVMELYREELVPRAEQSLKSAESGYLSGDLDFLYLLESERLLLELRLALAEREAEVEKTIAGMEELVGRELAPRR